MIEEALGRRITYRKGEGIQSEEVIRLEQDQYRSSKYVGDLGDLPRMSNDKDEIQACTRKIRIQKYLRERLLPPH